MSIDSYHYSDIIRQIVRLEYPEIKYTLRAHLADSAFEVDDISKIKFQTLKTYTYTTSNYIYCLTTDQYEKIKTLKFLCELENGDLVFTDEFIKQVKLYEII